MAFDATKKQMQNPAAAQAGIGATNAYSSLVEPGLSSAAPQQQTSSMPIASSAQPGGGSGFVNFGDVYNANAAAAQTGAQNLQASAASKGQAAQAGLKSAQGAFAGAVAAGTPGGPTGADFSVATGQSPSTYAGAAGEKARAALTPATNFVPGGSAKDEANWKAGQAQAAQGYTGPNALGDASTYAKLASDTAAAQDEATTLAGQGNAGIAGALQGSDNTSFDSALLGAGGRGGFAQLGRQYGGLNDALSSADANSQAYANNAKQLSTNAQNAYTQLFNDDADQKAKVFTPSVTSTITNPAPSTPSSFIPDSDAYVGDPDDEVKWKQKLESNIK